MEGKMFFSLLDRRLTDVLLENRCIDSRDARLPGAYRHTHPAHQRVSREQESCGVAGPTNAYGSIWHKLVVTISIKSGMQQPSIRANSDNLTVITASVSRRNYIHEGLEGHIKWARMSHKKNPDYFIEKRRSIIQVSLLPRRHQDSLH